MTMLKLKDAKHIKQCLQTFHDYKAPYSVFSSLLQTEKNLGSDWMPEPTSRGRLETEDLDKRPQEAPPAGTANTTH